MQINSKMQLEIQSSRVSQHGLQTFAHLSRDSIVTDPRQDSPSAANSIHYIYWLCYLALASGQLPTALQHPLPVLWSRTSACSIDAGGYHLWGWNPQACLQASCPPLPCPSAHPPLQTQQLQWLAAHGEGDGGCGGQRRRAWLLWGGRSWKWPRWAWSAGQTHKLTSQQQGRIWLAVVMREARRAMSRHIMCQVALKESKRSNHVICYLAIWSAIKCWLRYRLTAISRPNTE